jgi:hypothetical protein
MVIFLSGSLGLSLWFKGPFERLINMMFELTIMTNFGLLSVTMPANYIVMSAIMKEFTSFNVLRNSIGSN